MRRQNIGLILLIIILVFALTSMKLEVIKLKKGIVDKEHIYNENCR